MNKNLKYILFTVIPALIAWFTASCKYPLFSMMLGISFEADNAAQIILRLIPSIGFFVMPLLMLCFAVKVIAIRSNKVGKVCDVISVGLSSVSVLCGAVNLITGYYTGITGVIFTSQLVATIIFILLYAVRLKPKLFLSLRLVLSAAVTVSVTAIEFQSLFMYMEDTVRVSGVPFVIFTGILYILQVACVFTLSYRAVPLKK